MNLFNLFHGRKHQPRSSQTTRNNTVRLHVESLEGRELPSISPLNLAASQGAIFRPPVYNGPNFQGLSFDLQSADGKPAHTLTIQTQTNGFFYTAYITGTWQGNGEAKPITGTIVDINNNITITVSWANGQGGTNTLSGSITWVPSFVYFQSHWHLEGSVTVTDASGQIVEGGPGNVSGNAYPYSLIIALSNEAYAP